MTGEERRIGIQRLLREAKQPISATNLANEFGVSRQVIVHDIALLRAAESDDADTGKIVATNRGYILEHETDAFRRVVSVVHSINEIEEELNTVVDLGGKVLDVIIRHEVYGELMVPLGVSSRYDVKVFMEEIASGKSKPLSVLTSGVHAHTIEAENENRLDIIEAALEKFISK